jgi:hypothetical protein
MRLAAWSAFLVIALRLLHGSTMGTLSLPLGSADDLSAWADRTSPVVMAVTLVRLAALVAAWYLAAATVLMVVADLAGWRGLGRAVAAVSPAIVRRLATRSASAGLAAGALLGGVPLPAPVDASPRVMPPTGLATPLTPVLALATPAAGATTPADPAAPAAGAKTAARPDDTATMTRLPALDSPADDTATMTRLPGPGPTPTPTPTPPASTPTPSTTEASPASPGAPDAQAGPGAAVAATVVVPVEAGAPRSTADADEWVVEFGDSFWSIAEDAMGEATPGREPTEAEVAGYWGLLIAANRDRLADPGNPDLLLPGQRLVVPPTH